MKGTQVVAVALALLLAAPVVAAPQQPSPKPAAGTAGGDLATTQAKLSFGMGWQIGSQLRETGDMIAFETFLRGIKEGYEERESPVRQAELEELQKQFMQQMQAHMMQKAQVLGKENLQKAEAFLAANRKEKGVQATTSGLQYMVLKPGKGPRPKLTDSVSVHYEGKLLDGTVFDSSRERGKPAEFMLMQVIPGWSEGLQLMPVGSTYRFWIPPALAYGPRGTPGIPPNSLLVFEVELLSIEKEKPQPPGGGPIPGAPQIRERPRPGGGGGGR